MSVKAGFFSYISGITGVTTIIGTSPVRLFPEQAPTSAVLPYATYTRISDPIQAHMISAVGLSNPLMQIDCFATTYLGVNALSEAFRNALDGFKSGTWGSVDVRSARLTNQRDEVIQPDDASQDAIYKTSLDIEIWYARSVPTFP